MSRRGESPEISGLPHRRVSFRTLGCKLNQAETESIATEFRFLGWEIADFGEDADVVVVNSCTVTNAADRKSRSAMNQALRISGREGPGGRLPVSAAPAPGASPPGALVVITGCYAEAHREKLEADGRSYVVGNNHKSHIPQLVDAHFRGEILPGYPEDERDPFGYPLAEKVFRTRTMIKVQDGCDNFCTYCIIPFVRGRGISRPLEDTVRAVEEAAASGFREIVLTGVNMSRWSEIQGNGPSRKKLGFADLVEACLNAEGDFRLRLGSVEPDLIDERLVSLMNHRKITPHMHLCVQSGSEKILRSMKREYTAAGFRKIAGELRRKVPGFNITTDVIVGFPGESEEDFAETLAFCETLGFGHIHTFPYSRREGTRAVKMDGHVPEKVKKVRAEKIRRLSERMKRAYRESLIGSVQEVLVEKAEMQPGGGFSARGFSASYVPVRFSLSGADIPGEVRGPEDVQNRLFSVQIKGLDDGDDPDLFGEIFKET